MRAFELQRKRTLAPYGITPSDYDAMLQKQAGRCAICRTDDTGNKSFFHVDHCHLTGKVRGLLCTRCNTGIGHLADDPFIASEAARYLWAHQHDPISAWSDGDLRAQAALRRPVSPDTARWVLDQIESAVRGDEP